MAKPVAAAAQPAAAVAEPVGVGRTGLQPCCLKMSARLPVGLLAAGRAGGRLDRQDFARMSNTLVGLRASA